jgi:hypothetical protein
MEKVAVKKSEIKKKKQQICFGGVVEPESGKTYTFAEYRKLINGGHSFTGKGYKCESCNKLSCFDHTRQDAWDERLADGVFLCDRCYRANEIAIY